MQPLSSKSTGWKYFVNFRQVIKLYFLNKTLIIFEEYAVYNVLNYDA